MDADNDNLVPVKTCTKCKETKPVSEFYKSVSRRGKVVLRADCKACVIGRSKERYWSDTEAKKKYDRQRYLNDPVAALSRAGKWKSENPEKMEESRRKWREANPEKHKESQRQWAIKNPEKVQSNVRARRARKRGAKGSHTDADIEAILVRQKYKCAECGLDVKNRSSRQIDHIMPLKLGGSNWPTNLQVLCNTCNKVKSAKHPLDFALERGRLI